MRSHSRRYPGIAHSKLTSGAPSCNRALKRSLLSVHIGTITHVLAISGQHVAILVAVIYFALHTIAVGSIYRIPLTLVLIWLYILIAGAPPTAIRAGVVATLVPVARLLDRQISPLHCTNLQHAEGPLLGHAGRGAGDRGGAGVAVTRSCLAHGTAYETV